MNDIKVGDKLEIHCYKHNGKIDRISGEALVLDVAEDYLVCANNKVKITESDGKTHRTKETAILFFYKNEWFNILAQLKKFGLFYYCNIATPYIIDDNVIKYIDYDLDLRVFPNGSFKVLDRNEYKYHKKQMHYSNRLDFILKYELGSLIERVRIKKDPFNKKAIEKYYEKYLELLKKEDKTEIKVEDNKEEVKVEEIKEEKKEIKQEELKVKEENKEEKAEICIDDFAKIQLKTALVTACEKVEKSKKLLKLTLKIGDETRTIVSGIAEYYKPEEVVGKRIIIVYNLKTAKLCGVESHGMALCSEIGGKVRLIEAPEETGDGATVR